MDLKKYVSSKYIFFDFDGVIVDSEPKYYDAWKEASLFYDYRLTHEELLSLRSCDSSIASSLFFGMDNFNLVRNKRIEIMNKALIKDYFPLKPQIKELLKYLKNNNYKIVIASSSINEIIKKHLKHYDLLDYIYEIKTINAVKRGKPYPDIYIELCNNYNILPSTTLVIEDSPNGIKSAYSAGCNVIMVPDLTDSNEELDKMILLKIEQAFLLKEFL